jgi:nucleotide-binding universal stress UspA family protein
MIRRVLLGIGGTPFSGVAIQRAVEAARQSGASLTAVTVLDEDRLSRVGPIPLGGAAAAADLREHRLEVTREQIEEALETLKRCCADQGVPITIYREQGSPFHLMIEYARYHDLAVFGLRSMFEYNVLYGSDVEPATFLRQLIEGGVRPLIATSSQLRPIRRVLMAYSGSVQSAESMQQFMHSQLWPDAILRIVVCGHPQDQAERMLTDAAIYCRAHGYEPEIQYRAGDPKQGILAEAAEWGADMLVIGSSTQSWLAAIFRETTMLHIVRNAEYPLFVGR